MSTSTTHRLSTRAYVGVGSAPDEPQFQVRFTPDNDPAPEPPSNSFRWIGWGTLHIGARGVLVAARRRGWMGFKRRDRRFFPSGDIRSVYREGGAVRVELHDAPDGKQTFQFWPADLRAAATIVALLPTANTVEIDAPAPSETPAPGRRISPAVWVLTVAATVIAALIAASVAFLRQGEASLQTTTSGSATPRPATVPRQALPMDAEALRARVEFDRVEPQMEGLKLQFLTAIRALELGTVSAEDFSTGLERWLVPQWRMLGTELSNETPQHTSVRYGMHEELAASIAVWQDALQSYAQGLRERDNAKSIAAFAQMKRAEDFEDQARHWVVSLQTRSSDKPSD
jgi:hypothetical protein